MADRPDRRRGRALAGVAVLVAVSVVVAVVVSLASRGARTPVDQARHLVADGSGFDTGLEAGETLARTAQHLERAVEACRAADGGTSCQALSAALGYAQVLASWVLRCTAPGRDEARTRMASYLDDAAGVAPDAERVPGPPPLPSCST